MREAKDYERFRVKWRKGKPRYFIGSRRTGLSFEVTDNRQQGASVLRDPFMVGSGYAQDERDMKQQALKMMTEVLNDEDGGPATAEGLMYGSEVFEWVRMDPAQESNGPW